MGQNFKPYEPDQLYLMPPALSEWVSEGSLARFVSDVVERLDSEGALQPFYAAYRPDGRGRAAYAPLMMVKVLLYGYCKGITSSRRLAEALESDVGFRYLAANQQPNFRTISDFRKDHLEALSGLFVRLLQLCQEAGLVKMGRVALDGTKVPGNAALAANRTRAQLEAEVTRVFEEAEATDREEDARYGVDMRGDELPEGLRTPAERAARLQAAVDRLKAEEEQAKAAQAEKIRVREEEERRQGRKKRGRKPKAPESMKDPEQRANTTDPESRIMKSQRGWVQGYNAQAAAFHCHFEPRLVLEEEDAQVRIGHHSGECAGSWSRRWIHDESWVVCDRCDAAYPATEDALRAAALENECDQTLRRLADDGRFLA